MPRFAAVDIGSNSVRMMVCSADPGQKLQTLAEDRQVTRLGASVFLDGSISEEAMRFVCDNLAAIAQVLRKFDLAGVRAVATSAVRDAGNQQEFLERTEQALGYPVEIISGQEEARLIHLGVHVRWPLPDERRLLIDVGGGSTEVIESDRGQLGDAYSKPLGAVRLTEVFLQHDPPFLSELHRMNEYIDERLAEPLKKIGAGGFDRAIGTSATAAAIVSAANSIPRLRREEADRKFATREQVKRLYDQLSGNDLASRRKVPGIGPRRAELIVAGAAVFTRVLEQFRQPSLYYSIAGLRDGIIADLAARGAEYKDARLAPDQRQVVEAMAERYGVPIEHARQVARTAHQLFVALQPLHKLRAPYGRLLEAAAYLHDIGHFVTDTGHHKHSYYLVINSDMPGFTDEERLFIATLCRYHRKSPPLARHPQLQAVPQKDRPALMLLNPLLRLADSLDRSHSQRIDRVTVELRGGNVVITWNSELDTDLELWAAERVREMFHDAYGVPLVLEAVTAAKPVAR